MQWLFLILAIVFEVGGTTSMKLSQGFTRLAPSIALFVFYIISFMFLTLALRQIEITVTYAIWSGVGTALIAVIGFAVFNESLTPLKLGSMALIVIGVVGLNLGGGAN